MCVSCVKVEFPDRATVCLDSGSYMLNYAGCHHCGEKHIAIVNRITTESEEDEDDDGEFISYEHICQGCSHLVANHEHAFHVEGGYQIYSMICLLCGTGDDERCILPCDPNGPRIDVAQLD